MWGAVLDRPNFRRKVLATPGFVAPVPGAARLTGGRGKPAALYRAGGATALQPPLLRPLRKDGPHDHHPDAREARRQRILLGLALGDALGFPTEFSDIPSILAKFGPGGR